MKKFDKKIRKLSKDIEIPQSYYKKVNDTIQALVKEKEAAT